MGRSGSGAAASARAGASAPPKESVGARSRDRGEAEAGLSAASWRVSRLSSPRAPSRVSSRVSSRRLPSREPPRRPRPPRRDRLRSPSLPSERSRGGRGSEDSSSASSRASPAGGSRLASSPSRSRRWRRGRSAGASDGGSAVREARAVSDASALAAGVTVSALATGSSTSGKPNSLARPLQPDGGRLGAGREVGVEATGGGGGGGGGVGSTGWTPRSAARLAQGSEVFSGSIQMVRWMGICAWWPCCQMMRSPASRSRWITRDRLVPNPFDCDRAAQVPSLFI